MKTILIDSHVFLWALAQPQKLGAKAKELLVMRPVALSVMSVFELAQKQRLQRLDPSLPLFEEAERLDLELLNFDKAAVMAYRRLPSFSWNDPFDHMLIAQSIAAGYRLMTADRAMLSCNLPELSLIDATK